MNWEVWCCDTEKHVIPADDLRDHLPLETCWCRPEAEVLDNGATIYTHASMDRREQYETGALLPH